MLDHTLMSFFLMLYFFPGKLNTCPVFFKCKYHTYSYKNTKRNQTTYEDHVSWSCMYQKSLLKTVFCKNK